MSLPEAQETILAVYSQRLAELREFFSVLSGPQQAERIQDFIRVCEQRYPIRVASLYAYDGLDRSDGFYSRGATIQKYWNCFEAVWELCEQANFIGARRLQSVLREFETKPVQVRKRRKPAIRRKKSEEGLHGDQNPYEERGSSVSPDVD